MSLQQKCNLKIEKNRQNPLCKNACLNLDMPSNEELIVHLNGCLTGLQIKEVFY